MSVLAQDTIGQWWVVNGVWRHRVSANTAATWIGLGMEAFTSSNNPSFRNLLLASSRDNNV